MHIVLLNDDALPQGRGGVAVIVDTLRRGYAGRGHTVTLVTTHQDPTRGKTVTSSDGLGTIISIYVPAPGRRRHRYVVSTSPVLKALREILEQLHPDVVHAHNVHGYLTYGSLTVAKDYAKTFLTIHDSFAVSFARVGGPRYRASVIAGSPFRLRWLEHIKAVGRAYWPLRNRHIRKVLRSIDGVIVYSHAMERFLHAHGIRRTVFIHNGVDPRPAPDERDVQSFREKHRIDGPCVLYGGRISEEKGIVALLHAMELVIRKVPDAVLLIAGDRHRLEPFLPDCPASVRPAIRTTGWISPQEMRLAFHAADAVTTPSLYLDNFPTINLEAMEAAKPVVGTIFGGTPELVQDAITGYTVDPLDMQAYARRLIDLLKNPATAREMGAEGRKRVCDHFSLQSQLDETEALFEGKTATLPA